MILALTDIFGLSIVEITIAFAAAAYVLERALDIVGWSRSSKTLRVENEDLVRRNKELEVEVKELRREVDDLSRKVTDLGTRDQASVLAALAAHELNASDRFVSYLGVLTEIRDGLSQRSG
jgi:uncharacterized protein YlxW (UPF0749 family)